MKRTICILSLSLLLSLLSFLFAETLAWQGFEQSPEDIWSYQTNTVGSGYWGIMDDVFGGASPHSGAQYWASWNMAGNEGIITFANIDLPLSWIYTLSFHYYTRLLSSPTEYSQYCLSYDNGITWEDWVNLLPNTQAWTAVSIDVPAQYRQIKLKVAAKHSGTSKYAHWDSFLISRTPAPAQAPIIYNLQIAQRIDGSGLVDIWYDLFDANNDPATISMLISDDAGASFDISPDPGFLSGDIGAGIQMGEGKHVIWNAGAEGIAWEGDQYKFRLIAEDGTTYGTVATPVFDPPAGTYFSAQEISITCATDGATIYYTTDGSEPTEASTLYTAPISVAATITLKARAFKALWIGSEIAVAEYDFPIPENFVFVEGGTFNNGTSDVTISSFYIDKYELTQAGYQSVMGTNPSYFSGNPNRPVERVSWFNAIEYCNRRSIQEGLTPCYSYGTNGTNPANWPVGWNASDTNHTNVSCNWTANGYRLPTEMEWMFAAKGGNQSQGYTFSGSHTIENVARYSSNSSFRTWDVGGLAANELGTFDMSGNVWEWVWDIYGSYPSGSQTNPTGASSGEFRMFRGGSWDVNAISCTVSFRTIGYATNSAYDRGFRLCRVSP